MRVAHITLGLDLGGQEKLLVEFARHVDRARFRLHFLSLTGRGKLADEIESLGWPVGCLNEPPGFRPRVSCQIGNWLRRWRIDVVHTHDAKPLIFGVPAARMTSAKRVVHTRHFARLDYLTPRQIWLGRLASRMVDDYVCVSEESCREARAEKIQVRKLRTILNGIDLDRFSLSGPQEFGPAVLVARLSPEKDVSTLLKAIAQVVVIDPGFRLEIAGNGQCANELRAESAALGLADHVRFLGEVRDVSALLGKARFFVLSSRTEGISLTLLEAMARGLPIVATRVGGNPEVVVHGETGLLVPSAEPAPLARAMSELNRDFGLCRRLGSAGRQRAETHFDVRQMIAGYEAIYQTPARQLLEGQRK